MWIIIIVLHSWATEELALRLGRLPMFCDDWVLQLDKDDRVGLGLFLCFQLRKALAFGDTKAAKYAALMIGRNEQRVEFKVLWTWRNSGEFQAGEISEIQNPLVQWRLQQEGNHFHQGECQHKGKTKLNSRDFLWMGEWQSTPKWNPWTRISMPNLSRNGKKVDAWAGVWGDE